jgi:hypothetical protein
MSAAAAISVRRQEGPSALVETVIATRLGESFEHEDFWSTYLHWLTRHPMLDSEWVGPIADYLNERKFVPRDDGAGEPPEPNLSMKSPASTSCCGKWKSGTHA